MEQTTNSISKTQRWISYILQGILVAMFLMGAIMNLLQTEQAVAGTTTMGYPESSVVYLGLILLTATVLYAVPQTSGFGAILLTGWLGGAVATHIIHGDPTFDTLFPIIFALLVWFAIWLRQSKVKLFLKVKSQSVQNENTTL